MLEHSGCRSFPFDSSAIKSSGKPFFVGHSFEHIQYFQSFLKLYIFLRISSSGYLPPHIFLHIPFSFSKTKYPVGALWSLCQSIEVWPDDCCFSCLPSTGFLVQLHSIPTFCSPVPCCLTMCLTGESVVNWAHPAIRFELSNSAIALIEFDRWKLHQYLVESVWNTKRWNKEKIEKDRSAVDLSSAAFWLDCWSSDLMLDQFEYRYSHAYRKISLASSELDEARLRCARTRSFWTGC